VKPARRRRGPIQLLDWLRERNPELSDPEGAIAAGSVRVDGVIRTNPATMVRPQATVVVTRSVPLRGEAKLRGALATFNLSVAGRVALDVGAAAGGFTKVLLEAGARRVYAVDAGHGQLLGSLRQHPRVVNLEATNVSQLTTELIPETIEVVTVDVSYLSLSAAVAQVNRVSLAPDADLVGLVKPMFELRLGAPPTEPALLAQALALATAGIERAGWEIAGTMPSPVQGARGAIEMLVHAHRKPSF
jgi:23S rRNA (cytidine1920-2'-O)/16S rRNA (cytidine1409-2'-O)-methyltransferase